MYSMKSSSRVALPFIPTPPLFTRRSPVKSVTPTRTVLPEAICAEIDLAFFRYSFPLILSPKTISSVSWSLIAAFGFKCKIELTKDDGTVVDVSRKAENLANDVKEKGSVVVDEVVAKGTAVYDGVMEKAPEMVNDIREKGTDAYNSVVNKATEVWSGIKEKKNAAEEEVEEAFDAAEEKIDDFFDGDDEEK